VSNLKDELVRMDTRKKLLAAAADGRGAVGILRLRECFASRSTHFAKNDKTGRTLARMEKRVDVRQLSLPGAEKTCITGLLRMRFARSTHFARHDGKLLHSRQKTFYCNLHRLIRSLAIWVAPSW